MTVPTEARRPTSDVSDPGPPTALETGAALDAFATWAIRSTASRELSLTTAATLSTLARRGPVRLSELAAHEGVTQPSMTALVSRLERDGLAVRGDDPTDRRAVAVRITAAGQEVLSARRTRRASILAEILEQTDPADRAAIEAAAPALHRLATHAPTGTAPQETP